MSKSKRCYSAKPSACYFYVKTNILVDFHICISVPLMVEVSPMKFLELKKFAGQNESSFS